MSFCKPNKNFITTKQNIRIKKNIVPPSVKKKLTTRCTLQLHFLKKALKSRNRSLINFGFSVTFDLLSFDLPGS